MKKGVLLWLMCAFLTAAGQAQSEKFSFAAIDWKVRSINARSTDSLAVKLTASYTTETEKVRAIFSWVAQHISYNTAIFNRRASRPVLTGGVPDTTSEWKSADEMVADRVLERRVAVCDGYARLFKTLCEYAGIRCEVINGYVDGISGNAARFRTNHTWNAVFVDSVWRLIDVTWASGYIDQGYNFVHRLDDRYFFTPPHVFIRDHFPEDPQWTLLINPPAIAEFKRSPFKAKAFPKYGIRSVYPEKGTIEAALGDTVVIEIELNDVAKAKRIASSLFTDSLPEPLPGFEIIEPQTEKGNKIKYLYVVHSPFVNWLQLVYNKDLILQYRLNLKGSSAFAQ